MPSRDEGDLEKHDAQIKAPLTPPYEPESRGLAIDGVISQLEEVAALTEQHGHTADARHDHERQSFPNGKKANGVLNQRSPSIASPIIHHVSPQLSESRTSSYISNLNGFDPRVRRTSSEFTVLRKERRLSSEASAEKLKDLASSPGHVSISGLSPGLSDQNTEVGESTVLPRPLIPLEEGQVLQTRTSCVSDASRNLHADRYTEVSKRPRNLTIDVDTGSKSSNRPRVPRALSTPANIQSPNPALQDQRKPRTASRVEQSKSRNYSDTRQPLPSPVPVTFPLPPMSLPTYLQLELSSLRPPHMYVHRSAASDFPYESSRVKIERLLNFLFLPHQLEAVLWFGVLACLDAWLYTFTILPLRMIKSIYILGQSWLNNLLREIRFVADYVYTGSQRVYHRRRTRGQSASAGLSRTSSQSSIQQAPSAKLVSRPGKHHRRTKSIPSKLQPDDKADILKGCLIVATCYILLRLDASRMYHWVRGQAAIKLYVIYNLLEVCDRLLSAIGQDVLECLFSREALERKPDGHSKVLRPLWLFALALAYSVLHSIALFYQVITLNVAVNSYSNALITLLMSNQFVEIKGTVFKKFERENLFQLTCADVVERFQLWHMLMIIASRNIVETGILNIGIPNLSPPIASTTSTSGPNTTLAVPPISAASILPRSFMIVPTMLSSVGSYVPTITHVLGPFVIVLGSEMLIDWLKYAYINKFNNVRPVLYARFLDILAKDYYTNAFGEQNLTKRLGLPVIPLSCLMIRAGFQTYQMFVAAWMPPSSSGHAATLASIHQQFSATQATPTSTAGLIVRKMDELFNHLPSAISSTKVTSYFTTTLVILLMFLILLICKLILGMGLLAYSRARYQAMKHRETTGNPSCYVDGSKRVGGWGVVEVNEDKRRVIYEDDPAAMHNLRARDAKDKARKEQEKERGYSAEGLEKVS